MYLRRAGGPDQQKPTTLARLWRPSLGDPTAGSPLVEVLGRVGKEGPVELRADPCGGIKERVDWFLHCTNTFPTAFPPKGLPTPTFHPPPPVSEYLEGSAHHQNRPVNNPQNPGHPAGGGDPPG